jgi:exodeoxyribonuclease VIII
MDIKKYNKNTFSPRPGEIYSGVPNSVYHGLHEYISSSDIKNALESYDVFLYERKNHKHTIAMELSNGLHHVMEHAPDCEPHGFVKSPTDSLGVKWKNLKDKNPNIPVLSESNIRLANDMGINLCHFAHEEGLFKDDYYPELSVFWEDPETGLKCKCRPDLLLPSKKTIIDWKGTLYRTIKKFENQAGNLGYFISAAFYMFGCITVTSIPFEFFKCCTVTNHKPHISFLLPFGPLSIEAGFNAFRKGLLIIKNKEPEESREIEVPAYILREYLDD